MTAVVSIGDILLAAGATIIVLCIIGIFFLSIGRRKIAFMAILLACVLVFGAMRLLRSHNELMQKLNIRSNSSSESRAPKVSTRTDD